MIAFSSALYSATVASCSNVLLFKLLLQCCQSTTISIVGVTIFGFCHRFGFANFFESLQNLARKSETIISTWEWAAQLEVFTLNNFLCLLILTTLMDYKDNQKKNSKTVEWGIFFREVLILTYSTYYMYD